MMKRYDRTASLALVAALTVVSGALVALGSGRGAAPTVHAIERDGMASMPVEAPRAPAADLVLEAPVEARRAPEAAPEVLTAQLSVLDGRTGLALREASFRVGDRLRRLEAHHGLGYELELAAPGTVIEVRATGFEPRLVSVDDPGPREVRLTRRATLRGVVRDGLGAPIPHASVRLVRENGDAQEEGAGAITLRRAGPDGAYAFDTLAPGTYRTEVELAGETHASRSREVRAGEWAEVDHWLTGAPSVVVTVDAPTGLPAARARLLMERADDGALHTRYTDARGRAEVGLLPPGTYELRVQSADGTAEPRSFQIQESDQGLVELHLHLSSPSAGPANGPAD
ncbi:MAG: carboxypeptidase-like regulatory domain-containing protein [Planctomycetota bacterium]|jgi:hypothetical protein